MDFFHFSGKSCPYRIITLKDIVTDRSFSEEKDSGNNGGKVDDDEDPAQNFLNLFKVSSNKAMDKFDKGKKELTLAGLLEVLDGVMEMDGRMMVTIDFLIFWCIIHYYMIHP